MRENEDGEKQIAGMSVPAFVALMTLTVLLIVFALFSGDDTDTTPGDEPFPVVSVR